MDKEQRELRQVMVVMYGLACWLGPRSQADAEVLELVSEHLADDSAPCVTEALWRPWTVDG